MRYVDRYKESERKYNEQGWLYEESGWSFIETNPVAQFTRLDPFFGELAKLDNTSFDELYVKPPSKVITDVELHILSDITKINVAAWRKFYSGSGTPAESFIPTPKGQQTLIQIVAPMGAGKSTYLHYLLRFAIPRAFGSNSRFTFAVFDCREHWVRGTPIEKSIYEFLLDQASHLFPCFNSEADDFYKNAYQSRIRVFGEQLRLEGISDSPQPPGSAEYKAQLKCISDYCGQPSNWAASIRKIYSFGFQQSKASKFIFAIDNIDIFAELHPTDAIAVLNQVGGLLNIDTIITLRDTTYRITQPHNTCTSWHHPTTIILPIINTREILEKRLNKAKSTIEKDKNDKFYVFFANIIAQIKRPLYSLNSFSLHELQDWLDALSNNNTRAMLDIMLRALKSHHLTSETFARRFTSAFYFNPRKNINVKRFKTAFIIGNGAYFSEADSRTNVVNLFDAKEGSGKAWEYERHILCLKLLQYLKNKNAFIVREILDELGRLLGQSYSSSAKDCIRRFWQKGLIITEGLAANSSGYIQATTKDADFEDPRVQVGTSFISPNGEFHLNELIVDDIYLDEMKFVTNFSETDMHSVFENRNQVDAWNRLTATGAFARLIFDCEKKSNLSSVLSVKNVGARIVKAHNDRKAAELEEWKDM